MPFSHRPGRITDNGRVRFNRFQNDRSRAYSGAFTDLDITQHFCAGSNQCATTHFRMSISPFLTCSAQRDILQKGDIILHHSTFTHHNASTMIEHDFFSQFRGGMDIDSEEL